ncbi:MAG: choice-of-anchor tandem repeat GloVer-containing protein [Capsulimonadaceae bacterium]
MQVNSLERFLRVGLSTPGCLMTAPNLIPAQDTRALKRFFTLISIGALCLAPPMAARAQTFNVLHTFSGTDGEFPEGGVVQGSDGSFYGTTYEGGTASPAYGTVFKVTSAGAFNSLHSFNGTDGFAPEDGLVQGSNGNFYGTSWSDSAFEITPAGVLTTFNADVALGSNGDLIQGTDGNFYGTTHYSGSYGNGPGSVYKMTPNGAVTVLYSFSGPDGQNPTGGLVEGTDGNFYGTTQNGGTYGDGTVFKITSAGSLTTLYSFTGGTDGGFPICTLVQGNDGNFYGTTTESGAFGDGTVFKITPGGALTTLYSFTGGTDGAYPQTGLVQGWDGNFYGATSYYGAHDNGAIFKITPAGVVTALYSLTLNDGQYMMAPMVQGLDGNLYGTMDWGGSSGDGTVFQFILPQTTGSVYSWGAAYVGNGNFGSTLPVLLPSLANATAASSGCFDTDVLLSDETVWSWGWNNYGGVGNGTTTDAAVPVQVVNPLDPTGYLTGVTALAEGGYDSIALRSDGTVWAWGDNDVFGELGIGTSTGQSDVAVQVTNPSDPTGYLTSVVAIAAGMAHNLALRADGTLWAWGFNGWGQLGNGTWSNSDIPVQVTGLTGTIAGISAGGAQSLAVLSNGTVWAWGYNTDGELGNGTTTPSNTPVQTTGITNAVAVGAGTAGSLALLSDGTVDAWGDNYYGELGNGSDVTGSLVPVAVTGLTGITELSADTQWPDYHALRSDGTEWGWGFNNGYGLFGNGSTAQDSPVPVQVEDPTGTSYLTGIIAIAAGANADVALAPAASVGPTVATAAAATPDPVTGTTTALSVLGADSAGESNWTYTGPAGVTFSDNNDNTAQNATATFTQAGSYTFTATITDPSNLSVTSSVAVTVNRTVTSIVVTPQTSTLMTTNTTQQMNAAATDQFGAPFSTQPTFTWSNTGVGSIASTGVFSSGATPGTAHPAAGVSGSSVTGSTTITVIGGAAATPNPVTATTTNLSVPSTSGATYAWTYTGPATVAFNPSSTAQNPTATFTQSGSYTFTVTVTGSGGSATSSVVVTVNQTTTTIIVTPQTSTMPTDSSQQVVAVAYDQFALGLTPQPTFTWTNAGVGSITGTGIYSSGATAGTGNPTAGVAGSSLTGSTSISVVGSRYISHLYAWGDNSEGELGLPPTMVATGTVPLLGTDITTAVAVAAGNESSLALLPNGTVWAWGYNTDGELGNGSSVAFSSAPVEVTGLSGVKAIAAGEYHCLALLSNGTVWAWGLNGNGQLGNGTTTNSDVPVEVTGLTGVIAIATGGDHSLALDEDGNVWAWGLNGNGQLGNGTTTDSDIPVEITAIGGVIAIAGGEDHSLAVNLEGVEAWGANAYGQLGDGSTVDSDVPVPVTGLGGDIVTAVAGGLGHSMALTSSGSVYAWGDDQYGELGNGSTTNSSFPVRVLDPADSINYFFSQVTAISAGGEHSMAEGPGGAIRSWGLNASGELGDGTLASSNTDVSVHGMNGVVSMSAGWTHSLAVAGIGSPLTAGYNYCGELGDGNTTNSSVPMQVKSLTFNLTGVITIGGGSAHTLAIQSDGTLWSWGDNQYGQLGIGTTTDTDSPVQVSQSTGLTEPTAIAGGLNHSLAIQSGDVWGWGWNIYGQIGNNSTASVSVPTSVSGLSNVTGIAAGDNHSLAVESNGSVWAWGVNEYGQLGLPAEDPIESKVPVQVSGVSGMTAVAGGSGHSVGLRSDGTVRAWGLNTSGQLGNGSVTSSYSPVTVSGLTDVTAIAAGGLHTIALRSDGTVWCWGDNQYGELGNGTMANSSVPTQVTGLTAVIAIASGEYYSLALRADGTVWAWGADTDGELGDGLTTNSDIPVEMNDGILTGIPGPVYAIAGGGYHSLMLFQGGPPSVATPAAATPSSVTTRTTSLSVLGAPSTYPESALTYTWWLSSGPAAVTFSANGTNAAKNVTATFTVPGTYVFGVTVTDPIGMTVNSFVTANVIQTVSTIDVTFLTPGDTMAPGQIKAFAETVHDQFGVEMSNIPDWKILPLPVGTLIGSGSTVEYRAASSPLGTYIIEAAIGDVEGHVSVTVQ